MTSCRANHDAHAHRTSTLSEYSENTKDKTEADGRQGVRQAGEGQTNPPVPFSNPSPDLAVFMTMNCQEGLFAKVSASYL